MRTLKRELLKAINEQVADNKVEFNNLIDVRCKELEEKCVSVSLCTDELRKKILELASQYNSDFLDFKDLQQQSLLQKKEEILTTIQEYCTNSQEELLKQKSIQSDCIVALKAELMSSMSQFKAEVLKKIATDVKINDDKIIDTLQETIKSIEERIGGVVKKYENLWLLRDREFDDRLQKHICKSEGKVNDNLDKVTSLIDTQLAYFDEHIEVIAKEVFEKDLDTEMIDKNVETITSKILDAFNQSLVELGEMERNNLIDAIKSMITAKLPVVSDDALPKICKKKDVVYHKNHDKLKTCIQSGAIPMLVGPAGTGKSTAAEQIAQELGLHFYMANRIQNTFELLGFVDANGKYVTTQFFEAFTKGGLFLFDEIDASSPEALVTINAALAQRIMAFPGHPIALNMHKDFKVVCAGNTFGTGPSLEYTGRNKLDAATLDRFMVIEWDYDEKLEEKLVKDTELLVFCWELRKICEKYEKRIIISTRGIKTLEQMIIQNSKDKAYTTEELIKLKFFNTIRFDTLKKIANDCKNNSKLDNNQYSQSFLKFVNSTQKSNNDNKEL